MLGHFALLDRPPGGPNGRPGTPRACPRAPAPRPLLRPRLVHRVAQRATGPSAGALESADERPRHLLRRRLVHRVAQPAPGTRRERSTAPMSSLGPRQIAGSSTGWPNQRPGTRRERPRAPMSALDPRSVVGWSTGWPSSSGVRSMPPPDCRCRSAPMDSTALGLSDSIGKTPEDLHPWRSMSL